MLDISKKIFQPVNIFFETHPHTQIYSESYFAGIIPGFLCIQC